MKFKKSELKNLRIPSDEHWYHFTDADDNYEDDDEEATLEPVEAEETLAYQDRRQRRSRAGRYNDINKTTHISCLN